MATAKEDLINTVTNILVLAVSQSEVLSNGVYDTISNIIHWKYDQIREWCPTKFKLTTTIGEATCGDITIKCIHALAWWATTLTLWGGNIDLDDFDGTMMADCIDEAKLYHEDGKKDPDIKKLKSSHTASG